MNLIDFGMKYHAPLGGWIMIFLIYGGTVGTKITKTNIQRFKSILGEYEKILSGDEKIITKHLFSPIYFFSPENISPVASAESARRYFSWIYFLFTCML